MFKGDSARAEVIGLWECAYWRTALDHTTAARERRPDQLFNIEHRYDGDRFGITAADIREAFADYAARFKLN